MFSIQTLVIPKYHLPKKGNTDDDTDVITYYTSVNFNALDGRYQMQLIISSD